MEPPARSTFAVTALPMKAEVCIEVIAVAPNKGSNAARSTASAAEGTGAAAAVSQATVSGR